MVNHGCNLSLSFPQTIRSKVQETKAQNHQEQQYKEGHQVIAPNFQTQKGGQKMDLGHGKTCEVKLFTCEGISERLEFEKKGTSVISN